MTRNKKKFGGRVIGLMGDELIAEYNWFDFAETIGNGDTQADLAFSAIDLYDYSPSEQVKTGRVPYLRQVDIIFVPSVTYLLLTVTCRGANASCVHQTTCQVQDDSGEAALDEPAAAQIDANACIFSGYWMHTNCTITTSGADTNVVEKESWGRDPALWNMPLSQALSVIIGHSCYPAASAATASPGFWIGKVVVAWRYSTIARSESERLVKESS